MVLSRRRKILIISLNLFLIVIMVLLLFFFLNFEKKESEKFCGDGTKFGECSINKPYFCENGTLVVKVSLCGCPDFLNKSENFCYSNYEKGILKNSFFYFFDGNTSKIDFYLYSGVASYLRDYPIFDFNEPFLSIEDYKSRKINEPLQREYLIPFLIKIQNLKQDKTDQFRILVSLVQNIPYEKTSKKNKLLWGEVPSSKFPYEVLYDQSGSCGEKSELLAFFLKEMGYEVVLFYFPNENHEVVGVKCPVKYSYDNSGYCIIEITKPYIPFSSVGNYFGESLSKNYKMIKISDGGSLPEYMEEYFEARDWDKIYSKILKGESLNLLEYNKYQFLIEKYNLGETYYFN